jgi:signal peptidase I
VVCCRQEEWQQAQAAEAQETQFGLNGAVYLEPLTDEQIQSYLQQVKRPRLWAHIQSSDLQALLPDWDTCNKDGEMPGLRSPLLLNMLLVAYKDGQVIRSQSELFQAYIKAQFIRSGKSKYTEAQTRRYLVWLARQLRAEKTTEFEIEKLQPYWLSHAWQLWIYRLIVGLIVGLIGGLIMGPIIGLIGGLVFGFIILFFGLLLGIFGVWDNITTTDKFDLSARALRRRLIPGLIFGLIGLTAGLIVGLIVGLIFGLIVGLIELILGVQNTEICNKKYPNEGTWNMAKNTVFMSIVGMLLFTLPRLAAGQSVGWEKWILSGFMFGIYTLLELMKHGALRLLLWANGSIPWNYAAFLDHANKLRLVQSMGGRYRFIHDLLREEMIGSTPLSHRLSSTPYWIKLSGLFFSSLVGVSVTDGTVMVSTKRSQVTMPILQTGDLVFFDKYSYRFTNPKRYELVTFQTEGSEYISSEWIVGLPGETISIKDNQLLINGKPSDRPYTHFPPNYSIDKPFKVPAQSYFVMGKRIDKDGKIVPTGEVIQRKQLTSRCLWRLWPLQRFGAIK